MTDHDSQTLLRYLTNVNFYLREQREEPATSEDVAPLLERKIHPQAAATLISLGRREGR